MDLDEIDVLEKKEKEIARLKVELENLKSGKANAAVPKSLKQEILKTQSVVFATLSQTGTGLFFNLFKEKGSLDAVMIDEAAQASELMSLLPFNLNPKKVILVGDHK